MRLNIIFTGLRHFLLYDLLSHSPCSVFPEDTWYWFLRPASPYKGYWSSVFKYFSLHELVFYVLSWTDEKKVCTQCLLFLLWFLYVLLLVGSILHLLCRCLSTCFCYWSLPLYSSSLFLVSSTFSSFFWVNMPCIQDDLNFATYLKLALNSCLHLLSAGITGLLRHTCLGFIFEIYELYLVWHKSA